MTIRSQSIPFKAATLLGLFVLVLLCCPASPAQEIPVHMELFGGYSYMHFDSSALGFAHDSNLSGGNLSLSVPHLLRSPKYHSLGIVVDASGNYGSHLDVYNFLVGPQITFDKRGYTIFVHTMYGKSRERFGIQEEFVPGFSTLGRAIAVGGGLQKQWHPKLAIRIFQVDYLNNNNFGLTENNLRVSTGFVFQFGGK
jgi:hypothetical protein